MTPGRPRAGWKAWEPEEGTDQFYIDLDALLPASEPKP